MWGVDVQAEDDAAKEARYRAIVAEQEAAKRLQDEEDHYRWGAPHRRASRPRSPPTRRRLCPAPVLSVPPARIHFACIRPPPGPPCARVCVLVIVCVLV